MLKFQIVTKNDLKEAAKIERRRFMEEERKKRFFNAKKRIFGMDYEVLDKQIAEKKEREQIEQERERKYIQETKARNDLIQRFDYDLEKEKAKARSELNKFRRESQRKEYSREFDMNDPNFLKKATPARTSDNDPRLGISSAQIFRGEDLMQKDRKKAQKTQLRSWLEQQIYERKIAESDRAQADEVLQKSIEARNKLIQEQAALERKNRAEMKYAVRDFNLKLAADSEAKRKLDHQHSNEDNLAEIYNMLSSDMLTESRDQCKSLAGNNKVIAYLYRGMTPDQFEFLKKEQAKQVQDNLKKKSEQQLFDKLWEQHDINLCRTVMLKNIEVEKQKKFEKERMFDENARIMKEQMDRENYNNKVLYTNEASPEFYAQFNKTSR